MAVITRVGSPRCSRASWRASALMIVASMPMVSAWARSIPDPAPASPRQMLPPALHDLVEGLLGLALLAGEGGEQLTLVGNPLGRDVGPAEPLGPHGRHVEGDLVGQGPVATDQLHDDGTDAPVVLDVEVGVDDG